MVKGYEKRNELVFMLAAGLLAVLCVMGLPRMVFAEAKAYDLIIPDYDSRYLSDEEIAQMTPQVLCYGKNEIYAQHGRKFLSEELTEYFSEQAWYRGTVDAADFSEAVFNTYESANIKALTAKEKELQQGGYQLDVKGYSFQPIYDYINERDGISGAASGSESSIAAGFDVNAAGDVVSTSCFLFSIPEAWGQKWTYTVNSEDSISFCCGPVKANSEMDGGLCTILRLDAPVEDGYFPDADYLGESKGYYYYLLYPTDVRFDEDHADIYRKMEEGTKDIVSTFMLF